MWMVVEPSGRSGAGAGGDLEGSYVVCVVYTVEVAGWNAHRSSRALKSPTRPGAFFSLSVILLV